MISVGGVEGNRTPGLLHAEQTLSRLSYDPFIEGAVDLAGIEPANLLSAIQALSQLSYRPVEHAQARAGKKTVLRTPP